jgi:uncharacterized repeat protein (TIGR02543 family)
MREHSRGISISHNTVYGSISANPLDSHTDAPTSMEGTVIKNNLARWINTVHGDWPAEVVIGNNYTSTQWSSLIVDLEQDDYRVKAGSPLIDAGQTSGFTADFEGNPILGVPDIGAYEYSSGTITYTLTTSAAHGTIASTPNRTHYSPGETVTLQATPDSGYVFNGWADGLTGTANPATLVMNSNKSVTANFGPVAPTTYTLTVTAANGSVTRTPSKSSYTAGETVSLLAVPSSGYAFTGWSGAISGTSNPAAVVMDGSKSVTANFAVRTYTLDVSASSGSVTKNPNQATYPHGETVTLAAMAALGYEFTGWTGDLVGTSNPATVIMDGNKSITAQFSLVRADDDPPVLHDSSPAPDSIQVPLNSLVVLRISDEGEGVDGATVSIRINGDTVYAGNAASYSSAGGICRRMGDPAHYVYAYQPAHPFDFHDVVVATVNASDLAGNAMSEQSYSFETEMWAFGDNRRISTGPEGLDKGAPAAARDNGGNTWVAWHAGAAGTRDIYLARLASGAEHFGPPVRLTESASDQCNPDLAVGTDGTFYVVWQDNGRGNWDIHARTSRDGIVWSSPVQVTDSDQDEVHPAIAIDARSPNCAHVAWQDNRAGNDDIYVTSSSDGFVSKTIACVTSNVQDQVRPRIAIDASHTVHLVWTDYRNGSAGIVGAASNRGPWTNVPIAIGSGSQSDPVIAAEPTGSTLHFAWVNNTGGDDDIYYGCSSGLPASPLIGSTVVDDSSGADQRAPAIVAAGGPGGNARVFICWQDFRNAADHPDTDLYAIEVNAGAETNLYVGDGGTRARQSEPLVGVDLYGHPYVVWTDDRNGSDDIYFAASTFVEPTPLDTKMIARAAGGTVGAALPSGLDDVSVQIPAGACPYDVNVSIARIRNPRPGPAAEVRPYEFGPSGLRFDTPVTIRIPYTVVPDSRLPQPYWYDSMTGTWTQQSITNVEHIALSSTIHALQFQTTHFTPYALVAVADIGEAPAAGGSGGGGCSLVRHNGPGGAPEFFLPFVRLAAVMLALRRKDAKRRSDS